MASIDQTIGSLASFKALQAETIREQAELDDLNKEVTRLRKHRNQLKRKWSEMASLKSVVSTLPKPWLATDAADPDEDPVSLTMLESNAKRAKIHGQQKAFLALGLSGFYTSKRNELGISLRTCFKGEFCETFYIFLSRSDDGKLALQNHTLPAFIPCEAIASKFLQTDLKAVVDTIDEYLQAFEARRSQCLELKTDRSISGISASEACDYVQFSKTHEDHTLDCRFFFDLKASTPTRVTILTETKQRLKTKEAEFLGVYLSDGLRQAWPSESQT